MTAPLTPIDCDCRGLPFMPLEVERLMSSDFMALATGDEFKAGFILWARSWGQIPAASIPADDRILAHWVGRSLEEWLRLKEMALHGWIACDDGRLYHPLIADLAVTAAGKRSAQRERANSRWSRSKAEKGSTAMPRHATSDATASKNDATAMQGTVEEEGREPPYSPPLGDLGDQVEPRPDETRLEPGLFDPVSQDPARPPADVETAFEAWNELARRLGLPVAKVLDEGRRRSIRKRLAEGGLEAWTQALRAIAASRHCRGGNDRKWRADLDFVCQPKSWRRLLEGFYGDDAEDTPNPTAGWTSDQWRRALAISRETGRWDPELGPPAGEPGCRIPPDVLRELRAPPRLAAVEGRAVA